jgi:integral membrane protein
MKNPIPFLRKIAVAEAISFLVLMGVAMPLKYFMDMPVAVKVVGWIHGVLFVIFCGSLLQTMIVAKWPFLRALMIFIAALLPFGPFVIDRRMLSYEAEFQNRLLAK